MTCDLVYLRELSLTDFRSYPRVELGFDPGVSTLVGLNGHGKTNLVEAVGYLATLGSHRVAQDAPLIRHGADQAVLRALVVRQERESRIEFEIVAGRANRARLNGSAVSRPRDILGTIRTVLFAPEDLAMVKGDPGERRAFLDGLLVQRQPRWAGVVSDYAKILKQRTALLKSAGPGPRRRPRGTPLSTESVDNGVGKGESAQVASLDVWSEQLATVGAQLTYARLRLLRDLRPLLAAAYDEVSSSDAGVRAVYRCSVAGLLATAIADGEVPAIDDLRDGLLAAMGDRRGAELDRGVCLAGPHRDDLVLSLKDLPARGYASHGESWSFALGLRLAAYQLLRHDLGDDPVLVLDDVFAELDSRRRERLAALVADSEQVIITAAVPEDIPAELTGARYRITEDAVVTDDA